MYARSTAIRAEKDRLDDAIAYIRDDVMNPVLEMDGCIGLSCLVDRESGSCIVTTAWRDLPSLEASDAGVRPLRDRAAELFGGTPTIDVWEIAAMHRAHEAPATACARVTWVKVDPSGLSKTMEFFSSTLLPAWEQLPGFCSGSMFVDRATGRAVGSVTFDSRAELEATREFAQEMRRTAVQENDMQILDMGEFDLALAHLRVPETV